MPEVMDLAARLRDVLSDKTLYRASMAHDQALGRYPWRQGVSTVEEMLTAARDAQREVLVTALSSLLEEREREIREAFLLVDAVKKCTMRQNQEPCSICDLQLDTVREILSRLASSSSPGDAKQAAP